MKERAIGRFDLDGSDIFGLNVRCRDVRGFWFGWAASFWIEGQPESKSKSWDGNGESLGLS